MYFCTTFLPTVLWAAHLYDRVATAVYLLFPRVHARIYIFFTMLPYFFVLLSYTAGWYPYFFVWLSCTTGWPLRFFCYSLDAKIFFVAILPFLFYRLYSCTIECPLPFYLLPPMVYADAAGVYPLVHFRCHWYRCSYSKSPRPIVARLRKPTF